MLSAYVMKTARDPLRSMICLNGISCKIDSRMHNEPVENNRVNGFGLMSSKALNGNEKNINARPIMRSRAKRPQLASPSNLN